MKIAVVGSRTWANYPLLEQHLDKLVQRYGLFTLVTGTKRPEQDTQPTHGADEMADWYADTHGLPKVLHEADWTRYGRSAGPKRNTQIVEDADMVVAFWMNRSRGTLDTLEKAVRKGIPA